MKLLKFFILTLFFATYACGPSTTKKVSNTATNAALIGGKLTQQEVTNGLKEVLLLGADKAAKTLSQTNDLESPSKIKLPAAAQKITTELAQLKGFEDIEAALIENIAINTRLIAVNTHPIFTTAIQQLQFRNVEAILMGEGNAATTFFKKKAKKQLIKDLQPIIRQTLDDSSITEHWNAIIHNHKKIPFAEPPTVDFSDLIVEETMNVVLDIMGKEEVEIRTNKAARSSSILNKVFAIQDDNSMASLDR